MDMLSLLKALPTNVLKTGPMIELKKFLMSILNIHFIPIFCLVFSIFMR